MYVRGESFFEGREIQFSEPSGAWNQGGELEGERQRHREAQDAQNVTGCYEKVREDSRKSTKVRTEQGRKSAMLRIVTGGTNFRREFHE